MKLIFLLGLIEGKTDINLFTKDDKFLIKGPDSNILNFIADPILDYEVCTISALYGGKINIKLEITMEDICEDSMRW